MVAVAKELLRRFRVDPQQREAEMNQWKAAVKFMESSGARHHLIMAAQLQLARQDPSVIVYETTPHHNSAYQQLELRWGLTPTEDLNGPLTSLRVVNPPVPYWRSRGIRVQAHADGVVNTLLLYGGKWMTVEEVYELRKNAENTESWELSRPLPTSVADKILYAQGLAEEEFDYRYGTGEDSKNAREVRLPKTHQKIF